MRRSDRILERLGALHPKKIDLSLGRMERLLARLDNPERKLPPVFHVAGTNGKGSTVAYLRAALEAAGKSAHVYTSPHLVRFSERIRVAGRLIDEDALAVLLEECEDANNGAPITFFEITTAAAFLAFSRAKADATLLEVGLGGRLDATNVIADPVVTAISQIAMDHEQFLGNTLQEIAREKAGIAKKDRPLVVMAQEAAVRDVILDHATAVGAPLLLEGRDWQWMNDDHGFRVRDAQGEIALPMPALLGPHQFKNAALAVAALRAQDALFLSDAALAAGIARARWPARLQDITEAPAFKGRLVGDVEILLDGGHNPAGAAAVAAALKERVRPTTAIVGMLANKDANAFLAALVDVVKRVVTINIPGETSHPAETLAEIARTHGMTADAAASPSAAIAATLPALRPGDRLLICGSLYMAGQVLDEIGLVPD